jgi:hypothetical protein
MYVETYQPFSSGPMLVHVVRTFTGADFDITEPYVGGAETAHETFTKYHRFPKRYVEGGRRVEPTEVALAGLMSDLAESWKEGTDHTGQVQKLRWTTFGGGFGGRSVPGFDDTYAEWTTNTISKRVKLTAQSPKPETRQLEIDATRERVRSYVNSDEAVAQWVDDFNQSWADYAAWTREKLVEYVAELVKDLRVKDDWLDEQMPQADVDRLNNMNDEITQINDQIKVLNTRKAQLRERIYDKSRRVLETHLTTQQDPVLGSVFKDAIASVKGERPAMRGIFE